MGRFSRYLIALCLIACAPSVFADAYWRTTQPPDPNYATYPAALDQEATRHCGYNPSLLNNYIETRGAITANASGYQQNMAVHGTYISNGATLNASCNLFANINCSSPNVKVSGNPPSCTCPTGGTSWRTGVGQCLTSCLADTRQLTGKSVITGAGLPNATMCINYCNYALAGAGDPNQFSNAVLGTGVYTWTAKYNGNAQTCTATDSGVGDDPAPDMTQDGTTKNTSQWHKGDSCGYVNGKYYCTPAVAKGSCAKSDTGEVMCNTTAGATPVTPPTPDTGTAGTPAKPVAAVTQNGTTTSVYSAATAAGSTAAVGSGTVVGTGTTNGPPSSGGGSSSTVGTSANPSVEDCHSSGTCTNATNGGDTSVPTDAKEFGQSLSDFQSAVGSSPVVSAFSSVAGSIPSGGTAPSQSFSMLGQTFTFQVPPAVLSAVTDVLSLIMKAVWCLIAIRRFMSA